MDLIHFVMGISTPGLNIVGSLPSRTKIATGIGLKPGIHKSTFSSFKFGIEFRGESGTFRVFG